MENNLRWQGREKRRFPRAKFPCKVVIYLPWEHVLVTHTENIGCGGIRVVVEEDLDVSSVVGVEVFFDNEKAIRCKGKVVWKLEVKNPLAEDVLFFDLGLEFMDIKEKDKEIIKKLIDSLLEK